ncbi:hypothetical protein C6P40_001844 [Pichia californica]|uniref:Peptidase A1 domain-containing protein n=1 Tax=Pichia californica TaxID=460514 RepID=A0A9P6WIL7_9ASCO|nr:hypothetical protein C6P42_001831 [[Candida] californica]KAG0687816.1 hypothetical protein C6P40_001844 [[Candida] californica]
MKFSTALSVVAAIYTLPSQGLPASDHFPKSLSFETELKNDPNLVQQLKKRGEIISVDTDIHQILLTFPLSLGGHSVKSVVDTGSRSSWIFNGVSDSSSSLCSSNSCLTSTSNIDISDDSYSIYYRGNFGAFGKWVSAPLSLGGSASAPFKFGLADSITGNTGDYSWAGFGYDSDELNRDSSTHIIDVLHESGVIDNKIFQLKYSSISSWDADIMGSGSLTIGSYDTSANIKFFDMTENIKYYLAIPMNSISNSNGDSISLDSVQTSVFDSGSTSLLMKQKYIDAILGDIVYDSTYTSFFKCSDYENFILKFNIDSTTTISIPLTSISWNQYKESNDLCQLMVGTLPDDVTFELAFGQYAMKNLITVFDIHQKRLGLASNSNSVTIS